MMKTRWGKGKLSTAAAAAVLLWQLAGIAALAQTCMTQDLFLYIEPKRENTKVVGSRVRSCKKATGESLAVLHRKNSSNSSKTSYENDEEKVQKIAGRN